MLSVIVDGVKLTIRKMSDPVRSKLLSITDPVTHIESTEFDEAEVFANALEIDDVNTRNLYLNQVVTVDSVERQRLDRLLTYSMSNADFLEPTENPAANVDSPRIESVGDWLGPFRLLQQIGEGGMGTVYMAEQISPLQRRVAIKVIKPGMDSSQVLARFEAERQALAMMDHPNIARAIDVGISALGRTYFVMELVKGVPITRYCDELRLSTRQRLELFIPVCMAIQHAHQKGIIHRDLKPSNIMVAEYDGVAVPKVIDFGVAKAVNQQLTSRTLFTQFGQIVGTMEYMSPEQSRVNQLDIDTRSDIYSLGVLLYELITGTTPIQSQDLKEKSWDELARMIREQDAPSPSQRLNTIERIQEVAHQRNTESGKLSGIVKGELDWIVLKALDKQRSRRYQNAAELAEDLQRFLMGNAVLACPPSTSYLVGKYVKRHKVAFFSGGLLTAAIILGLVGTSWQAWQASIARKHAEYQRDIASIEALRAQAAQSKAQLEAAKSAKEAEITRAVADFVNNDLIAFADPNLEPNRDVRLREIVDRASVRVASLRAAPLVEASIRFTLAKSYLGLGEYKSALDHAEECLRLRVEHLSQSDAETIAAQLLAAEAQLKLSRFGQACETFESALNCSRKPISEDAPIALDCQHGYGVALAKLGKFDAAMTILTGVAESRRRILGSNHIQTLETDRELADLQFQRGEYLEAARAFDSAIVKMTEHFGDSHPLTLKTMAGAASVAYELGETEEARTKREVILARQIRVLGSKHPDSLLTASNLTLVAQLQGNPESQIAKNIDLMSVAEENLGASHAVTQSIAMAIAELLIAQGRAHKAIEYLKKSQSALQEFHQGTGPESLRVQSRIAGCLVFEGNFQQALDLFQRTLSQQQSLLSPTHLDTLRTQFAYASAVMVTGNYQAAELHLRKLIETARESDLKNHPLLQFAESKLATLESVLGREASLVRHQEVRSIVQKKYGPSSTIGLQLDIEFAESLLRFGRVNDAKRILEEDLKIVDLHFNQTHPLRGQLQDSLIEVLVGAGDVVKAIEQSKDLFELRKSMFGGQHPLTLRSQNQLGVILVQSGNPAQGAAQLRAALNTCRQTFGRDFPLALTCQQNLASTLGLLSINDRALRQETLGLYEDLLSIQEAWGVDHPDWLFSQLGFAGALGQQGRLLQAEQVFHSLLPKLIKTFGESHPITLRCRENYSSVLGSLGKYEEAIEQSRACLGSSQIGSILNRKVTHAAIEYHICSDSALTALDLLDAAFKFSGEPRAQLDWLFSDIPFFVDALVESGDLGRAVVTVEKAHALFSEKLGRQHPKSLFLAAKLLSLYVRHDRSAEAKNLLEELRVDLKSDQGGSLETSPEIFASIAKMWELNQGLQVVSLYSMAAQASRSKALIKAAYEFTETHSTQRDEPLDVSSVDYETLAINSLASFAQRGQLRSPRSLTWLMHSSDLACLREREDFKSIVAEVEKANMVEKTMRFSWNLAIVGEHQAAADQLRDFATRWPELNELGAVQYSNAKAWARCYEAANRKGLDQLASEYLEHCKTSLENCQRRGFLANAEERINLDNDDNFSVVRNLIPDFASLVAP